MKKQHQFKCITTNLNDISNVIDIEEIKASNLKEATSLVSLIQVAECQQNNKPVTEKIKKYNVIYSEKIGIVSSDDNFVFLVLGEDNEWWDYLMPNITWTYIVKLEWLDYVQQLINTNSKS